jgi:hypothetical protein
MLRQVRQENLEGEVYSAIEEVAQEIQLDVPFYPEVVWIGRNLRFEDSGLPKTYRTTFYMCRRTKSSVYLSRIKTVLLSMDLPEHIIEEGVHFLHLVNSGINSSRRGVQDWSAINVIIEMLGYFGSKLIFPERVNSYPIQKRTSLRKRLSLMKKDSGVSEFLIYSDGYFFGERLYREYRARRFSREEVRDLFLRRFDKPLEATVAYTQFAARFGLLL